MKNFHTHTKRCGHAAGEDEEYVLRAMENGYDEIGFSDHAPMLFPAGCGYYSGYRMPIEAAEDYAKSIKHLQNKYKSKIKIHFGFELEYYPALFERELEYLRSFGIDYLLLGQHYIGNEYDCLEHYCGSPTADENVLKRYIDQCIEGMKTGVFLYLAHPDLINFQGGDEAYRLEAQRLCLAAAELDIPLEYNFLGYTDSRHYPREEFWKIAAQTGCKAIIGLDAHTPDTYGKTKELDGARRSLRALGIEPIEKPHNFI